MANFSTVACTEVHGTRVEIGSLTSGPSASVSLQCDYANRFDLQTDLLSNGFWPFTPAGKSAPICRKVTIKPLPTEYTEDGQSSVYTTAELDVEYGFDGSSNGSGGGGPGAGGSGRQYFTETLEPQLELLSIQEVDLVYQYIDGNTTFGNLKKLDETNFPYARQYTFSIVRTFYNWVTVPTSFKTDLGKVNDAEVTFATLGLTFAAEEVLFIPQNASRSIASDGTAGFTVQVKFATREGGWNKWILPDSVEKASGAMKYLWVPQDAGAPLQFNPYKTADLSPWIF